jgi:hypothetical protein
MAGRWTESRDVREERGSARNCFEGIAETSVKKHNISLVSPQIYNIALVSYLCSVAVLFVLPPPPRGGGMCICCQRWYILNKADSAKRSRTLKLKFKLKLIYDRQSVGQSVLVSGAHLESMTRFILSLTIAGFLIWDTLSDERTGL